MNVKLSLSSEEAAYVAGCLRTLQGAAVAKRNPNPENTAFAGQIATKIDAAILLAGYSVPAQYRGLSVFITHAQNMGW